MEGHSSVWLLITLFKQFSAHSIIYIIIVIQDTCVDYSLTTHFVSVAIQSSLGDLGHILTGLLCNHPELGSAADFLIRNYGLLIRNYELLFRNYGLLIRKYELVIRNYELVIRNYELVIRNYEFAK